MHRTERGNRYIVRNTNYVWSIFVVVICCLDAVFVWIKTKIEIYCNIRTETEGVNPFIRLDTRSTSILKSWPVYTFLSFCVDMWFIVYCSCDLCLKVLWPKIYTEMGATLLRKIWKLNCKIFYSVLIVLFWMGK